MSFFGVGPDDWVDQDGLNRDDAPADRLVAALADDYERVRSALGFDFQVEVGSDGGVYAVAGDRRRFRAEIDAGGRLLFTGVLGADGPL